MWGFVALWLKRPGWSVLQSASLLCSNPPGAAGKLFRCTKCQTGDDGWLLVFTVKNAKRSKPFLKRVDKHFDFWLFPANLYLSVMIRLEEQYPIILIETFVRRFSSIMSLFRPLCQIPSNSSIVPTITKSESHNH